MVIFLTARELYIFQPFPPEVQKNLILLYDYISCKDWF